MFTRNRSVLVAALALCLLAACGSDDSDNSSSSTAAVVTPATSAASADSPVPTDSVASSTSGDTDATTTATAAIDAVEWTIEANDYSYSDVPDAVPVGTKLSLINTSHVEVHELVAVRLADDDTRSVSEIVTLPQDELGALIGPGPATVVVAPPEEEGFAVVGDGSLAEPGRYLIFCTIPLGADPAEFLAAAQASDGPPQVAGGAPHFTAGMFAELIVDPEL